MCHTSMLLVTVCLLITYQRLTAHSWEKTFVSNWLSTGQTLSQNFCNLMFFEFFQMIQKKFNWKENVDLTARGPHQEAMEE